MEAHKNIKKIFALLLSFIIAIGVMSAPVTVYASNGNVYSITYHLDGGTNALKNPAMYTADDTITLMDATKNGYDFAGWFLDSEKTQQISTISNRTGKLDLYAKFTPKTYTATFNDNGATTSSPLTVTLDDSIGTTKTYTVNNNKSFRPYSYWVPKRNGYVFLGWYNGTQLLSDSLNITADTTLKAKWALCEKYGTRENPIILGETSKEIFNSDGSFYSEKINYSWSEDSTEYLGSDESYYNSFGNGSEHGTHYIYVYVNGNYKKLKYEIGCGDVYNDNIKIGFAQIYDITNDKKIFNGSYSRWDTYTGSFDVEPGTLLKISVGYSMSDGYITHWGKIKLNLDESRNSSITPSNERTIEQQFNNSINTPSVSKTGYNFIGWYDELGNQITDTWQYTKDKTFTAKWQLKKYSITYHLDGGTNNPSNPSSYTIEDSITFGAPTKRGYTFTGWYADADFTQKVTSISQKTGNFTLYAKYTVNSYNLTLDGNEGDFAPTIKFISDGKEIKKISLFEKNSITAYRPSDKDGYIFAGWYEDSEFTTLFNFNGTIKNDTTLYAKWVECESNIITPEKNQKFNTTIQGKTEQLYAFVPLADGKITVTSESDDLDLYGILYDSSNNVLTSADDISSSDLDFSYTYDVKAGQLYYMSIKGTTALTSGNANINIEWTGNCTISGTSYQNRQISVVYGTNYTIPLKAVREGYVFSGWYDENGTKVTDGTWRFSTNKTLTAKWSTATYHTVTFKNLAGQVISSERYYLSEDIVAPELPTKAPNKTYTYTAKWNNNYTGVCTGDAVYSPVFDAEYINYTVTFKDWDGEVLSTKSYHFGNKITAPSNPTKEADTTYTYSFAGWDKSVGNCSGDTTYTAKYTPHYINYKVTFKNWDGTIVSSKNYHWGDTVTAPATPTKAEDALHTYNFAGWDKEVVNCNGNTTYTATYTKLRKDGIRYRTLPYSTSETDYVVYITDYVGNSNNVTIPDTIEGFPVTKIESTAFENCTGLITITFPESITSISDNAFNGCSNLNTVFHHGSEKKYINIGTNNTNLTDAQWHYDVTTQTFNGQSVHRCGKCNLLYYTNGTKVPLKQLSLISAPDKVRYYTDETIDLTGLSLQGVYANGLTVSLDATFAESVNADLSKSGKKTVTVTVAGASVDFEIYVHDAESQLVTVNSYWYPESTHNYDCNLDETKTFTYPGAHSLIVTFSSMTNVESGYDYIYIYDGSGRQIDRYTGKTAASKTLTIEGDTFKVKLTSDRSYSYWGYSFSSIKANMKKIIHIPVTDPTTVTCTQAGLTEGSHCEICGDILVAQRQVDALGHSYEAIFDWAEDHKSCIATLTCTRDCGDVQTVNCDITVNESNAKQTVHTATAKYEDFIFTDVLTCGKYLVTFVDWDGTQISSVYYHSGDEVVAPKAPTKSADETYTYKFAGWDKEVVACTGNRTYTATYTSTYIDYTVIFKNWDGKVLSKQTYHYGDPLNIPAAPTKPSDNTYTYTFAGWSSDVDTCKGNATYTAIYNSRYIDYSVVFKNWNGDIISSKNYHYGDRVTTPKNPTRASDNTYAYTFAGWNKEVVACVGNATYEATYTPKYIDYTVVFKNYNGDIISSKNYHYGDKVNIPKNPTRAADNTYTYTFAGWNKEVVACVGNATYEATYTPKYIDYTVVFKNYNGDVISSKNYHYGDKVNAPKNPTKAADNTYTYTFAGWDKNVVNCAGNTTYTATFNSTYIDYTVTFKNWDGKILSTETYHYGESVNLPTEPTREKDNYYTYTFAGWDKEVVDCIGNAEYEATYTATHYHTVSDWITDTAATVNNEGSQHKECTECGIILETEVISQLKPAKPTLSAAKNTLSGVKFTWSEVEGADSYSVYRKTYNAKTKKWSGWSKLASGVTNTLYLDKTTKSGKYYRYTVRATNEVGASGYNTSGKKTYFLSTPTVKTANSNRGITVKWNKIVGARGYIVYRKTTGGWTKLTTVKGASAVSFTDKTAKAGVNYRYTVKAYYGSYFSAYNTKGVAIRRLATPSLKIVTSTKMGITLKWGNVTGATGYNVYRKTGNGGWKKIATVNRTKSSYLDKTAKKGITYTYTVKAYYGTSISYCNTKGLAIKDKY